MNPVLIGGVMHVSKSDMDIAYLHDANGRILYDMLVESGKIVEDLA